MPWMKALIEFPYFGIARKVGESFEASESDAKALTLTGRAEIDGNRVDAETHSNAHPNAQTYQTRDMAAASAPARSRRNRSHA